MVTMHVCTHCHLYASDGSLVIAVELNVKYFSLLSHCSVFYRNYHNRSYL